ncbi:ras-related protein Rab-11A-like [Paramacrobiotus metropolitanus]|uniref:ras-related protein Rab-11A-like n=1 Tax=Paramacrobiotus metropolitanus TaxID=2943436 RepID=UPI002445EADC|nr:ras-related protein Rab-11A-like [Paramacrobiotus metropolitanus]
MGKHDHYDYLFKVILVGDVTVGKTNLVGRYTRNTFTSATKATVGVDYATHIVNVDGKTIKVLIWDTSGQERFQALSNSYYRGAAGALIVYDITMADSFRNVERWLGKLREHIDENAAIMLVGNKSDLEELRTVRKEEGRRFAEKHHLSFIETSAMDDINVGNAFRSTVTDIYEMVSGKASHNHHLNRHKPTEAEGVITITDSNFSKDKQKCKC